MRSVDVAGSKVFFWRRVRRGIRLRPVLLRRDMVYREIARCHRSSNNFYKKWDSNQQFSFQTVITVFQSL